MAAQIDTYPGQAKSSVQLPSDRWVVITPHDTNPLAELPKAIMFGGGASAPAASDLVCIDAAGNTATFHGVRGQILPIRPAIIKATGMTANTVVIALY